MDNHNDEYELTQLGLDTKLLDEFEFDSDLLDNMFEDISIPTHTEGKQSNGKTKVKKSVSSKLVKKVTAVRTRRTLAEIIADLPLQEAKLVAFPSFDRSDALIYFASTYSRLKNSGDNVTLSKLLLNRCSKDCSVVLSHDMHTSVSATRYLELSDLTDTLHPDSVCCMHSTKVVGNQIKSLIYFKFTDLPEMHEYANLIVTDPLFRSFFAGAARKETLRKRFGITSSNLEGDKATVRGLIDAGETFQVYGNCEFTITVDEYSKKIVHMQYLTNLTSVLHNGVQYVL